MGKFVIVCTSMYNGGRKTARLIRYWKNVCGVLCSTSLCEKKTVFSDRARAEDAARMLTEKYGQNGNGGYVVRFRVRNIERLSAELKQQL